MDDSARRQELKVFLRARRAAITPQSAGLAAGPRRRTPGLRREELAALAGVGVTWYTWLEQGREIRVSRDALSRIARALSLSAHDAAYLFTLAREEVSPLVAPSEVDERLRFAVDSIDLAPAWAADPILNVVAFNRLADVIYRFDDMSGPFARNQLWRHFADPKRIRLCGEAWDRIAASGVGLLRANYATRAGDSTFDALLSALREFPDFVRRWEAQYTAPTSQRLTADLQREDLGVLSLFSIRLLLPDLPGFVVFLSRPADDATRATLARLARRKVDHGDGV
jgi:transcriptional regulator with XRE-family HTH domain